MSFLSKISLVSSLTLLGACGQAQQSELSAEADLSKIRMCATQEVSSTSSLTGVLGKYWSNGAQLRVRFMNGDRGLQDRIFQVVQKWSTIANVTFQRVEAGPSDIRIRIHDASDNDVGSWSYIGTDARLIPDNKQTMNFGWLTPATDDVELNRVVLHEVGHALGFAHEHQNPLASIPWNKEAVYAYYAQQNWTRADVDRNLFQKLGASNPSEYDRLSIMHYGIDAALTLNGFSVGWNTELSSGDLRQAEKLYPNLEKVGSADFAQFDKDRDNFVTQKEINMLIASLGGAGFSIGPQKAEEYFLNADTDGDGLLNRSEFIAAYKDRSFPWAYGRRPG